MREFFKYINKRILIMSFLKTKNFIIQKDMLIKIYLSSYTITTQLIDFIELSVMHMSTLHL